MLSSKSPIDKVNYRVATLLKTLLDTLDVALNYVNIFSVNFLNYFTSMQSGLFVHAMFFLRIYY